MAIATKKKTRKAAKTASKPASKAKPSGKARPASKAKSAGKAKSTTKAKSTSKAKPTANVKNAGSRAAAKGKQGREAERSAPPLAEVDAEVLEFIAAIDRFKHENGRPFPSWSEVLLIVRQLGYRRVSSSK